ECRRRGAPLVNEGGAWIPLSLRWAAMDTVTHVPAGAGPAANHPHSTVSTTIVTLMFSFSNEEVGPIRWWRRPLWRESRSEDPLTAWRSSFSSAPCLLRILALRSMTEVSSAAVGASVSREGCWGGERE